MDFKNLKNFMDSLTDWIIPGNAISVYLGNEEVFRYQSGYADVENKIKMTDSHFINIYSTTKVTTAVSGMQLLERGQIVLDTPLYEIIPEFKEMTIADENGNLRKAEKPITLRHIFSMTSGMTYSLSDELKKEAEIATNGKFDTLEVVKRMARTPLSFEPGTRWQYSYGHDVLAAVVEVVSGKKYRDYVKENIFEPLGMNETFYQPNEITEANFAPQYDYKINADIKNNGASQSMNLYKISGKLIKTDGSVSHRFGEAYDSGGAGLITTVRDYAKLANALANEGTGKTGERILSPAAVELMKTNQLVTPDMKTNFCWPQLAGYGYGLGVRTMTDKAMGGSLSSIGEFGWGGAAGSTLLADTDKKLSYFYAHHMLNQQEAYYQPRLRNAVYSCL